MKNLIIFFFISLTMAACQQEAPKETIVNNNPCGSYSEEWSSELPMESLDGLPLHAPYRRGKDMDYRLILFFHQAQMNYMEYCGITGRLSEMGYNCIAVDLRSGGNANGYENKTNLLAKQRGLETTYLDTYQDIEAAVDYAYRLSGNKIYVWGSSYSAGLAIRVANGNPKIAKVLAFSPGEYYEGFSLKESISGMDQPLFVTSSKSEANSELDDLLEAVSQKSLTHFIPKEEGAHGSKALWESQPSNKEYWEAVLDFLQ